MLLGMTLELAYRYYYDVYKTEPNLSKDDLWILNKIISICPDKITEITEITHKGIDYGDGTYETNLLDASLPNDSSLMIMCKYILSYQSSIFNSTKLFNFIEKLPQPIIDAINVNHGYGGNNYYLRSLTQNLEEYLVKQRIHIK